MRLDTSQYAVVTLCLLCGLQYAARTDAAAPTNYVATVFNSSKPAVDQPTAPFPTNIVPKVKPPVYYYEPVDPIFYEKINNVSIFTFNNTYYEVCCYPINP